MSCSADTTSVSVRTHCCRSHPITTALSPEGNRHSIAIEWTSIMKNLSQLMSNALSKTKPIYIECDFVIGLRWWARKYVQSSKFVRSVRQVGLNCLNCLRMPILMPIRPSLQKLKPRAQWRMCFWVFNTVSKHIPLLSVLLEDLVWKQTLI